MKIEKIENKNRRLRKKLYLGEFAILGFEISCTTSIKDFDQYDIFIDEFIDYIDSIDLCFGGGGLELFVGFLCSTERYRSVTEEEQVLVAQWLEARSEVSKVEVSELLDANYA
ncbi:YggL 50S ribosome-binding family protein [Vibrio gallaecicus]|uniref:YggL family protein n=1 Tax=Vibrio gallaecicus TaxID=552386 RepID=A0ABV4NGM1_9VIBR